MIIVVTANGAQLEELEELQRFHLSELPGAGDVDTALRRAGLGSRPFGESEALIDIEAIRSAALGHVGPDWEERFAAMLDFAGAHGWISEDGRSIRAHIERPD